jgi:hypothetical protein
MRGEFLDVWSESWREIWRPLIDQEEVPEDIFCELYDEFGPAARVASSEEAATLAIDDAVQLREVFDDALAIARIDVDLARRDEVFNDSGCSTAVGSESRRAALDAALAALIDDPAERREAVSKGLRGLVEDEDKRKAALERASQYIVNDPLLARDAFERIRAGDFAGERTLIAFLERVHGVLEDMGGDHLANLYFNLLESFLQKFSLRYDLRRPCILCPTLPGLFASLFGEVRALGGQDSEVDELLKDFEEAIRDLRFGASTGRMKTCLSKEVMLLEGLASMAPEVTKGSLGEMCGELGGWPHPAVPESLKRLYGFASDRSGIRHGKSRRRADRDYRALEMRDLIAMSILLAGFTPYLTELLDPDVVYRGS